MSALHKHNGACEQEMQAINAKAFFYVHVQAVNIFNSSDRKITNQQFVTNLTSTHPGCRASKLVATHSAVREHFW